MNKISKICIILVLVMMAFTVGYKVGDSRGYSEGYGEGYSYDCRAEIDSLRSVLSQLNRVVDFQKKTTYETNRRLDSAAYHMMYGVRDSLRAVQYSRDSVDNWDKARKYNDSITHGGVAASPRKCANGEISSAELLMQAMGVKQFSGPVNCQNNRR